MDHNRRKTVALVLLLLILALAAAVRFYRLEAQSLWHDEGNSARIAERSIRLILEGAAGDIHPPLYYLALHYWRALLGQSEFALRSFSVMGGVGLLSWPPSILFRCTIARKLARISGWPSWRRPPPTVGTAS
jgi:uncharacterized membrane protein